MTLRALALPSLADRNGCDTPVPLSVQSYHLGTLKIAMRFEPMLMVLINVPTNTRLRPFVVANLHPCPPVMRSPFLAFAPLIVISFAMLLLLGSLVAKQNSIAQIGYLHIRLDVWKKTELSYFADILLEQIG